MHLFLRNGFGPAAFMLPGVIGGEIGAPSQCTAKLGFSFQMIQHDAGVHAAFIALCHQLQA